MITPSISEVMGAATDLAQSRTWTVSFGSVSAVNGDGTVDVDPGVQRPVDTAEGAIGYEQLPTIPNCRILFLQVGNASITLGVAVGTTGVLLHPVYSAAEWRQSDGSQPAQPQDVRSHQLGQAFFLPALVVDAKTSPYAADPDLVLEPGANYIRLGGSASDFVPLDSKLQHELNAIKNTLLSANAPGGTGGPVTYGTPYVPGSTASSKVKIEP